MNRVEFKKAMILAASDAALPGYLSEEMATAIGGCANDKARRFVTLAQVASLVRGHCQTLAGTWDFSELDELQQMAKRFDVIG